MESEEMKNTKVETTVVIYGATPGGIAAAVTLARRNIQVVLVHHHHHLGGTPTSGLSTSDTLYIGNRSPFTKEFVSTMRNYYEEEYGSDSEPYQTFCETLSYEAHVAEAAFSRIIDNEKKHLSIVTGMAPLRCERDERRVHSIIFTDEDDQEILQVYSQLFFDCSYEADMAAICGVPYRVGREGRDEFNEPHAGKIYSQYESGQFPSEAVMGDLNLRPFEMTTGRIFSGSSGKGDECIQAYNYRITLSPDPNNRQQINPPENYDRNRYLGIIESYEEAYGKGYPLKSKWLISDINNFKFHNWKKLPRGKINWNHGNFPGGNHEYPTASRSKRKEILKAHKDHELGLLYFLQNDESVPAKIREYTSQYGLAKDEFTDNGNFPYEIYVREARRIIGQYILTENDCTAADGYERSPVMEDSIAIAEWPMDSHECNTDQVKGSAYEGAVLLSELTRPAQVPFRCILPEKIENVIVSVCISATHIAWGTIRVEPTLMHISEAAAVAAALSVITGTVPAALDMDLLQRELVQSGIMISFFNDFDMESEASYVSAIQFFGTKGFFPTYNAHPEKHVTHGMAISWYNRLNGICDAQECARKIMKATTNRESASDHMSRRDFKDLFDEDQQDNGKESRSDERVTIGEACEILYDAYFKKKMDYDR